MDTEEDAFPRILPPDPGRVVIPFPATRRMVRQVIEAGLAGGENMDVAGPDAADDPSRAPF